MTLIWLRVGCVCSNLDLSKNYKDMQKNVHWHDNASKWTSELPTCNNAV